MRLSLVMFIWIALLLAGCAGAVETPVPAAAATLPAAKTATRSPTLTTTPTATHTPLPTRTLTPTPQPTHELGSARLRGTGFLPRWEYFFTVQAGAPLEKEYYGVVARDKRFTCEVVAQNPDRLYCWGPLPVLDAWVAYGVYEVGTAQLVHSGRFYIPLELGE